MAELQFFNPVQSFHQGQQAGMQNALLRQEMDFRKQRPEMIQNALTSGDTRSLFAQSPETGAQVQTYLDSLGERERAEFKQRHDMSSKLLAFVESQPPEQRTSAYQHVAPQINSMWGGEVMPAQYDPMVVGMTLAQARDIDDILGKPERYRPLSAEEARSRGLTESGYQINDATGKVSKIGGATTTIQMPGQQKSEDAEFGKFLVEDLKNVSTKAEGAAEELSRWQMLSAFEIPTGPGEETKLSLRNRAAEIAAVAGIAIDPVRLAQISDAKTYKSVTQDLLRSRLAAQKGPQTEGDAIRMSQTLSQLDNPQEANRFIEQANIALAKRTIEQEQFYLDYRQKNGTLDGAKSAWSKFKQQTPLMAKNPNTNKPVFYTEFMEAFLATNPQATRDDALNVWRSKYAR